MRKKRHLVNAPIVRWEAMGRAALGVVLACFGLGLMSCAALPKEDSLDEASVEEGPFRDPRYLDRHRYQGPPTYPGRNAPYF